MLDDEFALLAFRWVKASHFTTEPLGWFYKAMLDYYGTYDRVITPMAIREAVRFLDADRSRRYGHEVDLILASDALPEAPFLKAKLAEFVKQAIFVAAHSESRELFNRGQLDEAYGVMATAQDEIQDVTFETVDRIWLMDSLPERQRERMQAAIDLTSMPITTGIPQLDEKTDGGVHPGELWAVLAYAKRCKTTFLINQGFNATRVHHIPTVHFILEGRGHVIASRYDACFSQSLYSAVRQGAMAGDSYRRLQEEYTMLRKLLVIRTINEWDVTILDIQAELSYLKNKGFVPGAMVLDYMDLGRARDARVDSELQHQLAFARDTKKLVNNTGLRAWSAWQAQRPKPGAHTREHVLTSASVADAYAKVRIVNSYGSLNATDEEMENGEMRVFWEGHRDAAVNGLWRISNDLARMRMITGLPERVERGE